MRCLYPVSGRKDDGLALVRKTTAWHPKQELCRRSDRYVVLTQPLRAKPFELNSGLPEEAYDDTVRQIVTAAARTMNHSPRGR